DEGDSGTFADRMVMEGDPFLLIEGMTIAAYAVGATEGYIYIRSEYPDAVATMRTAIEIAHGRGWLGDSILGSSLNFDLHVRVGGGAYICGEETSMLEPRGETRHGAGQTPDPRHQRLVRQADGGEQCAHPCHRADRPCRCRTGVSTARCGTVTRHPGVPTRWEHQAGRHRRDGVRGDARRTRGRLRRRHPVRSTGACGPGRWAAGCLSAEVEVRPADGLRGLRGGGCDGRPRRRRGVRRNRRHGGPGQVRDGVL